MGKKIFNILASFVFLCSCGFSQADSSYTVMVDDDNVLVQPTALQLKQANGFVFEDDLYKFQINFDTSPSAKIVQTTKTITINTPCRYFHSASCVCDKNDIENVRKLAEAMLCEFAK